MAHKLATRAYAQDEVRAMMEARRKAEHDEATRLEEALDRGREQGREEGRLEGQLHVARKLLEQGLSREQVLGLTGLGPEAAKLL